MIVFYCTNLIWCFSFSSRISRTIFVYNSSSKNYGNEKDDELPSTNYTPDDFGSSSSRYKDDYTPKHREQVNIFISATVWLNVRDLKIKSLQHFNYLDNKCYDWNEYMYFVGRRKNDSSSSSLSHDNMPKGEEKGGEKWMTDQPTNTVLLRGLPTSIDEKDVSILIMTSDY